MTPLEYILVGAAVLLLLSVIASKASGRLGVPALLLFLVIGMLAGSEGPGGIEFDNAHLAQSLGVVALSFILFAGGLETQWESISSEIWRGLSLSTLGVVITATLVGTFAMMVLEIFGPRRDVIRSNCLIDGCGGGILSLGLKQSQIKRGIEAIAGVGIRQQRSDGRVPDSGNHPDLVESGIPHYGILFHPSFSKWVWVPVLGYALGKAMIFVINRLRLEFEGLYPVLSLAGVLFVYGLTTSLGGNGFLAVYVAGILLGSHEFIHKKSLILFHDGLAWLMQITMFLTLGLLVFPRRLPAIAGIGLIVSLFLIFVARPVKCIRQPALRKVELPKESDDLLGGIERSGTHYPSDLPSRCRNPQSRYDFQFGFLHRADLGSAARDNHYSNRQMVEGGGSYLKEAPIPAGVCFEQGQQK